MTEYVQVKDKTDLVRDTHSSAIVNKNKGAYELAKKRAEAAPVYNSYEIGPGHQEQSDHGHEGEVDEQAWPWSGWSSRCSCP